MFNRGSTTPVADRSGTGKNRLSLVLLKYCILVTIGLSAIYYLNPQFIQFLSFKVTDTIQQLAPLEQPQRHVEAVAIDERSLNKYGQWPWPRYLLAKLLDEIADRGAKVIAVNILFPEPDRTSPKAWLESAAENLGVQLDISTSPLRLFDFDHYLANSLSQGPFVLGYTFGFSPPLRASNQCNLKPIQLRQQITGETSSFNLDFFKARNIVCNYPPLAKAVEYSGFLNITPDIDGSIRRLPLLINYNGSTYPSFVLAILSRLYPRTIFHLLIDRPTQSATLSIANLTIPLDHKGNFLLQPIQNSKVPFISAADILEKNNITRSLKDTIVVVGLTAAGLNQAYTTPSGPHLSSLELQRNILATLGANLHPVRTIVFPIFEICATILLCLLSLLSILYLPNIVSSLLCACTIFSSWFIALTVYKQSGYLFSPLLPTVSLVLNHCCLITAKAIYSQQRAKSEKTSALQQLHSSDFFLQSVLNTIPDIVYRLDKEGKISFISPAVSKYSKSAKSMLGVSIFDLVPQKDRDKAKFHINERRTGKRATTDMEIRLLLSNDSDEHQLRYFSVSAEGIYESHPPGVTNAFHGTQGIIKDITDRKKLEQQLLQAQKMEVVGNLAAGIAHDLNNILSGIVSYPDLLLTELGKENPLYETITIIQDSGKKAAVIAQDLLTLSRRNINITKVCNLNTVIDEYLNSAEYRLALSKNPNVTVEKKQATNLFNIKGSTAHLSKVIMNVFHNAFEAMPIGGKICISSQNIYFDKPIEGYEPIPEGEYATIAISDSGIGISNQNLGRIFEPFFSKKSMRSSGSGLGMTVIWATIKDHHGFIDINSKEGEGTSLTVFIPTTREIEQTTEHRIVLEDFIGSETVLIVDDSPEQRTITEKMLSKLGYHILVASSGVDALHTINHNSVDLLILDMIMVGGLDGLDTYKTILGSHPHQRAIIVSGFSERERVAELISSGAGAHVQKPFTMEEIGMAVRREIDRP